MAYDRGRGMTEHERPPQRLAIRICFPDPQRPWQRVTNQNTNGMWQEYLPKSTDLSDYTQRKFNTIAHQVNTRPQKYPVWAMPLKILTQLCHQAPVTLGT
ncbi:MAG: IS30 family transposase [Nitrospira sp.]|nr:IS30 family transposase [Nitrospira sp.]